MAGEEEGVSGSEPGLTPPDKSESLKAKAQDLASRRPEWKGLIENLGFKQDSKKATKPDAHPGVPPTHAKEPVAHPMEITGYNPFNPDLDKVTPVDDFGIPDWGRDQIVEGKFPTMNWVSLFRTSPAMNMEAEGLMGRIVTEAIRAGQWVDLPEPEDEVYDGATFRSPNGGSLTVLGVPLEYKRGAKILEDSGLAKQIKDDAGNVYLKPTEEMTKFITARIHTQTKPKSP